MIETSNATTGSDYCLRLYNNGNSSALDVYSSYGELSIIGTETKRYSKNPNLAVLPTSNTDLTYYLDSLGYTNATSDNSVYDLATSSSAYPVFLFNRKHRTYIICPILI